LRAFACASTLQQRIASHNKRPLVSLTVFTAISLRIETSFGWQCHDFFFDVVVFLSGKMTNGEPEVRRDLVISIGKCVIQT
jgi:hypothetical protein